MAQESQVSTARSELLADFNKLAGDTESLLRAMASVPGDKASELRASVEANLSAARRRVRELQGAAYDGTTAAIRATDEYVHDNPWPLICGALAAGFILGLVARRD